MAEQNKKEQKKKQPQPKGAQGNRQQKRPELSREERAEQDLKNKIDRVTRDPQSAVVLNAEEHESRELANLTREVNTIAKFIRANIGTARVSMELGTSLIQKFQEQVKQPIMDYLNAAHEHGIGSRFAMKNFNEQKAAERAEAKREAKRISRIESREIPAETKARETEQLKVSKAEEKVLKAQQDLASAIDELAAAQEAMAEGYIQREAAQKERWEQEKAAEAKAAENTEEIEASA